MRISAVAASGILGLVVGAGAGFLLEHKSLEEAEKKIHWPLNPPSDSPIIVRGGSLNALAHQGGTWTATATPNLFQEDLGANPKTIYLGGVDESGTTTNPQDDTIPNLTTDWTISFTLREPPLSVAKLCTHLIPRADNPSLMKCDPSPSAPFSNHLVYLEAAKGDSLVPSSFDNANKYVRLHYVVNGCSLVEPSGTVKESDCDKIRTVSFDGIPKYSGRVFQCVDGACDIGIDK
jgi:hypothetical protein